MPVMDGYESARAVRAAESAKDGEHHIPIVAMTAHATKGDRKQCLTAGMDDYLAKPFELKQLTDVLARWLPGDEPEPAQTSEPAARSPS